MIDIPKEKLKQFLDSDGKIMVSDDMPEDLKAAINYMNSNNISLFSEPGAYANTPEDDGEEENEVYEEVEDSDMEIVDDLEEDTTSTDDSSIDDLEDIF